MLLFVIYFICLFVVLPGANYFTLIDIFFYFFLMYFLFHPQRRLKSLCGLGIERERVGRERDRFRERKTWFRERKRWFRERKRAY